MSREDLKLVMVARSEIIASLVQDCADGRLPFSGPDSLHAKISAMGFTTNGLYEQVMAAKGMTR